MKRRPLLAFLALMFLFSWSIWIPLGWAPASFPLSPASGLILGALGPGIAAVVVTALIEGAEGLRKLAARLLIWRVGWAWYAIALLLPAGVSLLSTALHMMFGGDAPDFSNPPVYRTEMPALLKQYNAWTILAPVYLLHLFSRSAVAEELGWRGFVLVRLQQRFRALDATLIVSVLWTLWLLPLLYIQHQQALGLPFLLLLIGVIPAQLLTTWIFNSTSGSLLLAVLFNNTIKVTDWFVTPPATSPVIPVAAFWLTTLLVVSAVGTTRLTLRSEPALAAGPDGSPPPARGGTTDQPAPGIQGQ